MTSTSALPNPSAELMRVITSTALAPATLADVVESRALALPQSSASVFHRFGPGVYMREVHLTAGDLVIGHRHLLPHLNVMLSGSLILIDEHTGEATQVNAPHIYVAQPGRKIALVLAPTVWLNVIATEERDIAAIEAQMLDQSPAFRANERAQFTMDHLQRQADRDDFDSFLRDFDFSAAWVREQSERTDDMTSMPDGAATSISIRPSPIDGVGVFSGAPVFAFDTIGPARINGKRTVLGRYVNHSGTPNCHYIRAHGGEDIILVASRDIRGAHGGDHGEELTVDYRQALITSGAV